MTEFSAKLFAKPLIINGNTLQLTTTRTMKDIIRNPVTKVLIFEAPFQLRSTYIIQKLAQYGQLQSNEMYMHKYRGTEIYNGVRSVNFLKIDKPIPTTMFVKGNRVRLRHEDQDRTPICGICRVRGHYRDKCPTITTESRPVDYTDVDNSPPLPEAGTEMMSNWRKITEQQKKAKQEEVQKKKEEEEAKKLYIQRQQERKEAEEHRMRVLSRKRSMRETRQIPSNDDEEDDGQGTFQTYKSKKEHKKEAKQKKMNQQEEVTTSETTSSLSSTSSSSENTSTIKSGNITQEDDANMHSEDGDDELDLDSDESQAQPTTEKQQQQQQQQHDLPLSGTISPSYPECAQRSSVQQSPDTQTSRDLHQISECAQQPELDSQTQLNDTDVQAMNNQTWDEMQTDMDTHQSWADLVDK